MSLFTGEGGEFSSHTGSLSEGSLSSPQEILTVVINKGYVVLNTGHTCEVTSPQLEDPPLEMSSSEKNGNESGL